MEFNQVWLVLLSSQGWCFPLLISVWFSVCNLTTCKIPEIFISSQLRLSLITFGGSLRTLLACIGAWLTKNHGFSWKFKVRIKREQKFPILPRPFYLALLFPHNTFLLTPLLLFCFCPLLNSFHFFFEIGPTVCKRCPTLCAVLIVLATYFPKSPKLRPL